MEDVSRPFFSDPDEPEIARNYRRISPLAIVTLLLGAGSVVALSHPAAWLVPLIAFLIGVFALLTIHRSENVSGEAAALLGVALSLFFVTWAVSSYYFQRHVVYAEAQVIGRQWLRFVVDGEGEMAHQAMLHPARRQARGFSVDDYYRMDGNARDDMEKLFSKPPAETLLGLGSDAKIELVENVTQDVDVGDAKLIRQVYRVSKPGRDPIRTLLSITRQERSDLGRANWIVAEIAEPVLVHRH